MRPMEYNTSALPHITNGLAERFVQSMKNALKASQGQGSLHQRLNRFLLRYRNVPHATTRVAPAVLLMKRQLRTDLDLLKPRKTKDTVHLKQQVQVQQRQTKANERVFCPGDNVLARNYNRGPKWVPATVLAQTGPVSYTVQTTEGIVWRRHTDQLLAGETASGNTSPPSLPMVYAEHYEQDNLVQPTLNKNAPGHTEPAYTGPTFVAVSETERSTCSTPTSVPVTPDRDPPDAGAARRYPQSTAGTETPRFIVFHAMLGLEGLLIFLVCTCSLSGEEMLYIGNSYIWTLTAT